MQALQQEARQQQQQQQQQEAQTPDEVVCPKTPDSSEDGEGDERLKDVLSRAQHMQTLVRESLSSSLPISGQAEASSLSRWESEPGLSSSVSTEVRGHRWSLLSQPSNTVCISFLFVFWLFICLCWNWPCTKRHRGDWCSRSCFSEVYSGYLSFIVLYLIF